MPQAKRLRETVQQALFEQSLDGIYQRLRDVLDG